MKKTPNRKKLKRRQRESVQKSSRRRRKYIHVSSVSTARQSSKVWKLTLTWYTTRSACIAICVTSPRLQCQGMCTNLNRLRITHCMEFLIETMQTCLLLKNYSIITVPWAGIETGFVMSSGISMYKFELIICAIVKTLMENFFFILHFFPFYFLILVLIAINLGYVNNLCT